MQGKLRQVALSIYFFAAGVAVEFARWLMRSPRTTAAGIAGAVAYLASHLGLDLGETAKDWIVILTLLAIAKLAADSHSATDRKNR